MNREKAEKKATKNVEVVDMQKNDAQAKEVITDETVVLGHKISAIRKLFNFPKELTSEQVKLVIDNSPELGKIISQTLRGLTYANEVRLAEQEKLMYVKDPLAKRYEDVLKVLAQAEESYNKAKTSADAVRSSICLKFPNYGKTVPIVLGTARVQRKSAHAKREGIGITDQRLQKICNVLKSIGHATPARLGAEIQIDPKSLAGALKVGLGKGVLHKEGCDYRLK